MLFAFDFELEASLAMQASAAGLHRVVSKEKEATNGETRDKIPLALAEARSNARRKTL